jgi:hypothetical protein
MIFTDKIKETLSKIWDNTPDKIKYPLIIFASVIYAIHLTLMVYTAIRSEVISAYDQRWYELAQPHMTERDVQIKELSTSITAIKSDVSETKLDVREIRVHLMGPVK